MNYSWEDWKEIGKKLAIARQRRRISQRKVSDETNINSTKISAIETGKVVPSQKELDDILKVIGIGPDELVATQGIPILRRDGSLFNIQTKYKDFADNDTFGYQVRLAREGLGWTMYDLQKKSGVSRNYICEIEKGHKSNISWEIRQKLSNVLGLDKSIEPLPIGLEEYTIVESLTQDDVAMLRGIHCSGVRPDTVAGWRRLHNAILGAISGDEPQVAGLRISLDDETCKTIKEILEYAKPYSVNTVEQFAEYATKLLADYGDVLIEGLRRVYEGDREVVLKIELDPPDAFPIPVGIVGQRIRELRREKGITQKTLAIKSGIGKVNRVYQIERGMVEANREELEAIAKVFGVEVRDLLQAQ